MTLALGLAFAIATRAIEISAQPPAPRYGQVRISVQPRSEVGRPNVLIQLAGCGSIVSDMTAKSESECAADLARLRADGATLEGAQLIVKKGSHLEDLCIAVKATQNEGAKTVAFYGCIAPGCGVLAGSTTSQKPYAETAFSVDSLQAIIQTNLEKC